MKKLKIALAVLLACVAVHSYADQYDEGVKAAKAGDHKTAGQIWRSLADQGDARAQYMLGLVYFVSEGVPQHYLEAIKMFRKAADQGYADTLRISLQKNNSLGDEK